MRHLYQGGSVIQMKLLFAYNCNILPELTLDKKNKVDYNVFVNIFARKTLHTFACIPLMRMKGYDVF